MDTTRGLLDTTQCSGNKCTPYSFYTINHHKTCPCFLNEFSLDLSQCLHHWRSSDRDDVRLVLTIDPFSVRKILREMQFFPWENR